VELVEEINREIEIERKVALILATQFWAGLQCKDKLLREMTREEYEAGSLAQWIRAAHGVISLIKGGKE
jgi:hypothetical protein